ncbi:MAG: hypothetical protein KatS3mg114_0846 [Planctomycetaceae bacterium]|nr:MAG: hypothetical protein KatS3mg114_0846 [Planctomycetaceae bacterium]
MVIYPAAVAATPAAKLHRVQDGPEAAFSRTPNGF